MKKMKKEKVLNILTTVFSVLIVLCFIPVVAGALSYGMTEPFYTWVTIIYLFSIGGDVICNLIENKMKKDK